MCFIILSTQLTQTVDFNNVLNPIDGVLMNNLDSNYSALSINKKDVWRKEVMVNK